MHAIVDLQDDDSDRIVQVAGFLCDCFQKYSPNWLPSLVNAKTEISKSFLPGRRSRVLLDDGGKAVGWIGAIVNERVWEVHPIVVSLQEQRKGYGKRLVDDISTLARDAGAVSLWAGTSDETGATSFSQFDLYTDLPNALANVQAASDHPINFWLKAGFSLVGVLPDEEGLGKPGVHFAKRIVG